MIFNFAKKSQSVQNLAVNILSSIHPSIEHNIQKINMLKKAFFHCELEQIEGSYFEFGVYEGTSMYAAYQIHKKLHSKICRNFYGFDSFDQGFKYFNEKDRHPYFKEGDFKSSYEKVLKRFRGAGDVHLIPGYFENTIKDKNPQQMCNEKKCAVIFIDCDLMGPSRIALDFIRPALQMGGVIILDDFWAYRGNPDLGTCGAMNSFLKDNPGIKIREYYTYGYGGKSFIVTSI